MTPPDRDKKSAQNAGTFLALMGLVLVGGSLLLLVTAIMPDTMRGFFVIFLIFSGMLSFHYFTWGRWLERKSREQRQNTKDE